MSNSDQPRPTTNVSNNTGSNINVGENNSIRITSGSGAGDTEVQRELNKLRARIQAEAPPETQSAALNRVAELEAAGTAVEPDKITMRLVWLWFSKHLPGLAGTVGSLILGPIGGRVVEAVGDGLTAEVNRYFELDQPSLS